MEKNIPRFDSEFDFNIDNQGVFYGYASVFNVVDKNNDVILPGAFFKVNKSKVKLLWQHKFDNPIGKILHLEEDKKGLLVVFELILSINLAKDAFCLLTNGAINGLSIGYVPNDYELDSDKGINLIYDLDLWEISIVTFPANQESNVFFFEYKDFCDEYNVAKKVENIICLLD